jgi:hypothetical protein
MALMKRVWILDCPGCPEKIVLPHQNPLGISGNPLDRPTGIWPLTYWCENCGLLSEYSIDKAHRQGVPLPDQSPQTESLWRIDYRCDPSNSEVLFSIYAKLTNTEVERGGLQRVLEVSGVCGKTGHPIYVKAARFLDS